MNYSEPRMKPGKNSVQLAFHRSGGAFNLQRRTEAQISISGALRFFTSIVGPD
jgi:hypothetical protein